MGAAQCSFTATYSRCLPENLERQLDIAWLIALATALNYLAKGSIRGPIVVPTRKCGVIECVEGVDSELRMESFVDIEALREAGIQILGARIADSRIDHVRTNTVAVWN